MFRYPAYNDALYEEILTANFALFLETQFWILSFHFKKGKVSRQNLAKNRMILGQYGR